MQRTLTSLTTLMKTWSKISKIFKSSSHNVFSTGTNTVIILLSFFPCTLWAWLCSQSIAVKCVQPPSFNFLTENSKVCSICSGRLYLSSFPDPRINPSAFSWFPYSDKQRSPLPHHRDVQTHRLCDWFHLDIVPTGGCVSIPWLAGGPSSGGWRLLSISPQPRSQLHSVFTCDGLPDTADHNLSSLL